jgi:hypothetical protein
MAPRDNLEQYEATEAQDSNRVIILFTSVRT